MIQNSPSIRKAIYIAGGIGGLVSIVLRSAATEGVLTPTWAGWAKAIQDGADFITMLGTGTALGNLHVPAVAAHRVEQVRLWRRRWPWWWPWRRQTTAARAVAVSKA